MLLLLLGGQVQIFDWPSFCRELISGVVQSEPFLCALSALRFVSVSHLASQAIPVFNGAGSTIAAGSTLAVPGHDNAEGRFRWSMGPAAKLACRSRAAPQLLRRPEGTYAGLLDEVMTFEAGKAQQSTPAAGSKLAAGYSTQAGSTLAACPTLAWWKAALYLNTPW